MRALTSVPLILILATLVHVDWHFARPVHHRLSLGWSTHWLFAIAFFVAAGWYIGRRWSDMPWRTAAWNVGLALILAQVIEPLFEAASDGQLGYPVTQERWAVFFESMAAGLPALVLGTWLSLRGYPPLPRVR
jgi:hypothetical protein